YSPAPAVDAADASDPPVAPGVSVGGTYVPHGGPLPPPRNVTAYAVALATSGVEVRERVTFTGLATEGDRVTGVQTSAGPISAPLVVLTGGPELAEGGKLAGVPVPAGGGRHPVAVPERHAALAP